MPPIVYVLLENTAGLEYSFLLIDLPLGRSGHDLIKDKMIASKNNIDFKIKEYLFHLNNANDENGIRPFEGWKFAKVDLAGRSQIEHGYHPTVSVEIEAKNMDSFAEGVFRGLEKNYPKIHVADQKHQDLAGADHFVAFCADRIRR